jgi:hypothetical protein
MWPYARLLEPASYEGPNSPSRGVESINHEARGVTVDQNRVAKGDSQLPAWQVRDGEM